MSQGAGPWQPFLKLAAGCGPDQGRNLVTAARGLVLPRQRHAEPASQPSAQAAAAATRTGSSRARQGTSLLSRGLPGLTRDRRHQPRDEGRLPLSCLQRKFKRDKDGAGVTVGTSHSSGRWPEEAPTARKAGLEA